METIKVRIKKCRKPTYWYDDLIGKEFEVKINGLDKENYIVQNKGEVYFIGVDDCEVIETSKEDKVLLGYECPMDFKEYGVSKGEVFKRVQGAYSVSNNKCTARLPKEIVETWKPVFKPKEKTQRELDNEEIKRIEVEIMKSDKTISEYLIENGYYIGKRTKE